MNVKMTTDGAVEYEWVKTAISYKSSAFYTNSPGYKLLGKNDTNSIFAFKRPIYIDEPVPHHLEKCTGFEVNKLEKTEERWQ